jgi:hypothetical protein
LGETADSWASRETSASLAFFERLRLRVAEIFLTEALVTLGAISCSAGSSAVTSRVEGAAVVSFGGSSSSLQEETSYVQHERKKASTVQLQSSKKHLRCQEVKVFNISFENRGFISRCSL